VAALCYKQFCKLRQYKYMATTEQAERWRVLAEQVAGKQARALEIAEAVTISGLAPTTLFGRTVYIRAGADSNADPLHYFQVPDTSYRGRGRPVEFTEHSLSLPLKREPEMRT
jgi:hypothetical protein